MAEDKANFRRSIAGMLYHPVPYLLLKQPPRNNILIGDDASQIRFVEQLTGLTCETRDSISDDDLFGKDGVLYRLLAANGLNLSPSLRNRTGIWSLAPITSGSAAASAVVRSAAEVLNEKLTKDRLESLSRHVGWLFEHGEVVDLRAGLWETVWAMTADLPPHGWKEPWESASLRDWMPPGVDLGLRLGALFKKLRVYVLLHSDAEMEAKKMGFPPHKLMQLKNLRLNPNKVHESLKVLSRWKNLTTDPLVEGLALTKIWLS